LLSFASAAPLSARAAAAAPANFRTFLRANGADATLTSSQYLHMAASQRFQQSSRIASAIALHIAGLMAG
jgi:hypothetical protein